MTDWQLIQAYTAGDEDAFATLVQKYYSLVYGAACRQVSDTHLAEDVTQCVFLLFARKAKALSPATAIGGWFLRTVRFVAKDAVRKARRWRRVEDEKILNETTSSPGLDSTGPLASLEEAILALPAREQICLLAKYYEGKNFREIGVNLNISEDAAQKRVARALDKMRVFFHRRGFKISSAAIPALLTAGFSMSAQGAAAPAGAVAVVAAVKGNGISSGAAALTAQALKLLVWKQWITAGTKTALALILTGAGAGWIWVNRKPPVPARPAFQVNDARIAALGSNWSQVMQRAAAVRQEFPQRPGAGDPRLPALRAENRSLFRDRMNLGFNLEALSEQRGARVILPAYVTSGLGELLDFSPAQRAFVFDFVQQLLPGEIKEQEGSDILETNKAAIAAAVRGHLSIRQRRRFDQVCGPSGEYFLINRTGYNRGPAYLAWQDWLGEGGILTGAEAMEEVPVNLW